MFSVDINDTVIVQQKAVLERALSTNPQTERALRKLIQKVLQEARAQVASSVRFANGDPHESIRAIRRVTYKRILGGNINIYNSRRAHGGGTPTPEKRKTGGSRGGNRMPRSARTQRMLDYGPLDRGFILRFVNDGTTSRAWASGKNTGSIAPRNFLGARGLPALQQAADNLAALIDNELMRMLNTKKS